MLRSKVSRTKASGPRERFLTNFSEWFKWNSTFLEKNRDAVVLESKEETKETGLETAELSCGGKSDWFNLKDKLFRWKGYSDQYLHLL